MNEVGRRGDIDTVDMTHHHTLRFTHALFRTARVAGRTPAIGRGRGECREGDTLHYTVYCVLYYTHKEYVQMTHRQAAMPVRHF